MPAENEWNMRLFSLTLNTPLRLRQSADGRKRQALDERAKYEASRATMAQVYQ